MIEIFFLFSECCVMLYIECKKHNDGLKGEDPVIPYLIPLNIPPELPLWGKKKWFFLLLYEELSCLKIVEENNTLFEIMINNC